MVSKGGRLNPVKAATSNNNLKKLYLGKNWRRDLIKPKKQLINQSINQS